MTRDLEAAARSIVYEYDMFVASCFLLSHYTGSSQVVRNLSLEGALLHARNLADFLRTDRVTGDDIHADHFFEQSHVTVPDVLDGERQRLNKRLAHPSYKRSSVQRTWHIDQLYSAITKAWSEFRLHVTTAHPERAEWFRPTFSLPMLLPAAEWGPQWMEAESSIEWWEPEDLHAELSEVLAKLNVDDWAGTRE